MTRRALKLARLRPAIPLQEPVAEPPAQLPALPKVTLPTVAPARSGSMTSRQLRHLAESARLEERPDHAGSRFAIWSIVLSLLVFFIWAGFARLPEITRANGEIRPLGLERAIQLPAGGTLQSLFVRDGDHVVIGQPIAQLDASEPEGELDLARQQALSLQVQEEWLTAVIESRPPDFAHLPRSANDPEIISGNRAYTARLQSLNDRKSVLTEQIAQLDIDLNTARDQTAAQTARVAALAEVQRRREQLFDKGLVIFSTITAGRQELADAMSLRDTRKAQEEALRRQKAEVTARAAALDSSETSAIRETLLSVRSGLSETLARIDILTRAVDDRRIVADIAGMVTLPDNLSPGTFIAPGAPLAYIVPDGAAFVARVRIPADQISRVAVGQQADIKVAALDFTRFGRVTGTLQTLSPTTILSDRGEVYYTAEIALETDRLSDGAETRLLRPGMAVQAELLNGTRTILAYLFKPVEQALDTAFREE